MLKQLFGVSQAFNPIEAKVSLVRTKIIERIPDECPKFHIKERVQDEVIRTIDCRFNAIQAYTTCYNVGIPVAPCYNFPTLMLYFNPPTYEKEYTPVLASMLKSLGFDLEVNPNPKLADDDFIVISFYQNYGMEGTKLINITFKFGDVKTNFLDVIFTDYLTFSVGDTPDFNGYNTSFRFDYFNLSDRVRPVDDRELYDYAIAKNKEHTRNVTEKIRSDNHTAKERLNKKKFFESFRHPKHSKPSPPPPPPKVVSVTETPKPIAAISKSSGFFSENAAIVHSGMKDPLKELDKLIGLENVKEEVQRFYATMKFQKENNKQIARQNLHMCFLGNPGTGKTTVARIMTGLLYDMGAIKENKCVEVNALQLCGNYVGQTAAKTHEAINFASNGVLFLDEAYSLFESGSAAFGNEAVSILLKEMEDNNSNVVVILAGYEKLINEFLDTNSGFRSRINHYFKFEDFSKKELVDILFGYLAKKYLIADDNYIQVMLYLINIVSQDKGQNFGNARFVRNLVDGAEQYHIDTVCSNEYIKKFNEATKNVEERRMYFMKILTLTLEDLPENPYTLVKNMQ